MRRLFCLLFLLLAPSFAPAKDVPNIVFILADDMSFDSVSANNEKIGPMKTPHLDRLISQGMNFMDAHSGSAVCTPTRYGLLTGRYCWRTELKSQVLWTWGAPLIKKERLTVADLLREQGYATGLVGKWHLGMDWYDAEGNVANADLKITDAHFKKDGSAERIAVVEKRIDFTKPITGGPTDHGFDYYFGVDVPNFPPYLWIENDKVLGVPSMPKPSDMFGAPGPMLPGWKLDEILPSLARRAGEWIAEKSKKDQPFFLYVPLTSPHSPIAPSKNFRGKSGVNAYVDFVMETDWAVGQIVEALDKAGVADNTLLIFTTDNGTAAAAKIKDLKAAGIDLNYHFKGFKSQIHEGGHRVPFVARWPGKIKPGSTCEQTICLNDFMATTADLLGVTLPTDAAEDSTSFFGLLTGEKAALPNRPPVVHHDYNGRFAIRRGKWKLVTGTLLYDLDADPKETTDLASKYPEIVSELAGRLKKIQGSGRSRPES